MNFKEVVKILKADGWVPKSSPCGSHFHYKHPTKSGKVTVPYTTGDIHKGTLRAIFKQAGIKRKI